MRKQRTCIKDKYLDFALCIIFPQNPYQELLLFLLPILFDILHLYPPALLPRTNILEGQIGQLLALQIKQF